MIWKSVRLSLKLSLGSSREPAIAPASTCGFGSGVFCSEAGKRLGSIPCSTGSFQCAWAPRQHMRVRIRHVLQQCGQEFMI